MLRTTLSTRALGTAAIVGIGAFATIVLALHVVQRGTYHPLSEAVSELALGRGGWLMFVAFCALATGTLCVAALLRRTTASTTAPVVLGAAGALSYVSAVFHADGEHAPTTLHGQIHQTAGIVTFLLLVAGMFACRRMFRRDPQWQPLARPTLAFAGTALATFFLIPAVGQAYFGVAQRLFIAVCLSWLLIVAQRGRHLRAHADDMVVDVQAAHA